MQTSSTLASVCVCVGRRITVLNHALIFKFVNPPPIFTKKPLVVLGSAWLCDGGLQITAVN